MAPLNLSQLSLQTSCVVWLAVLTAVGVIVRSTTGARHEFSLQWQSEESVAGLESWGLRDVVAPVGKLFEYQLLPKQGSETTDQQTDVETGSGEVAGSSDTFTVHQLNEFGDPVRLPDWMLVDKRTATIRGVPDQRHFGRQYRIQVTSSKPSTNELPTTDDFWIQVIDESSSSSNELFPPRRKSSSGPNAGHHHHHHHHRNEQQLERTSTTTSTIAPVNCPHGTSLTTATVVLDVDIDELTAVDRIDLLRSVADHFRLPASLLRIRRPLSDRPLLDLSSALTAGPGNLPPNSAPAHSGLLVQWDVGCGNVRAELMPSLELLETSAANGRLSDALPGRPNIVGWHVAKTSRFDGGTSGLAQRRSAKQTPSSARRPYVIPTATPALPIAVRPTSRIDAVTVTIDAPSPTVAVPSGSTASVVIVPTLTIRPPPEPTSTPSDRPVTSQPVTMRSTGSEEKMETSKTAGQPAAAATTTVRDMLQPSVPTIAEMTTTKSHQIATVPLPSSATTRQSTKTTRRPKTPRPEPNQPPVVKNQIGRIEVAAGNILWFAIPNDTFVDREDGVGSDQLTILFQKQGHDVLPVSWIKWNATSRTLYGLPGDSDIGKQHYKLAAVDSQGKISQMDFEVDVGHGARMDRISHEFSVVLQLEYDAFIFMVERRIDVASRIASAYGDADPGRITVTRIRNGSVIYSWTNNTVPAGPPCPEAQIQELSDRIIDPTTGKPRQSFVEAMHPYHVNRVESSRLGSCKDQPPTESSTTKHPEVFMVEPSKSSVAGVDGMWLWLIVVFAAVVVGFLVVLLFALCIVCCCRARRRSIKQRRQRDDELSCANKGIPVIFADELEDDAANNSDDRKSTANNGSGTIPRAGIIQHSPKTPDDTPVSTLKRRVVIDDRDADEIDQQQSPPPPEYPRSDPASRTSTLRSDYKVPLINSDESGDEDADNEAARRSDEHRRALMQAEDGNGSPDSGNVLQHLPQPPNTGSLPPYQKL